MYQRTIETLVGLFMILGFLALAFLALRVSGLTVDSTQNTYKVYAQFDDVGGLTARARVTLAGVPIGKVTKITLDKKAYNAVVEMKINSAVDNLPVDTIAAIQTSGLLGENYVAFSIGADTKYLKNGDTIFDTQPALNLEKLIGAFATGKSSR
jgi:phospholipid/cholesterol/gamma-HCH transport system substrate-binding protein